jgi:ABC-type bacteriocin/lantibiotic exporter with double-glycine peptidase domain
MIKKLDFPIGSKQLHGGSCGPNLMKQIILYKTGLDISETKLIDICGCSEENGTSTQGMINLADNFNLKYYINYNSSIYNLIHSINRNNPAIILIQEGSNNKFKDWSKIWDRGHYVGISEFDEQKQKISYYDPLYGKIKSITYENLNKRWHDKDSENTYEHFGIFFKD